MYAQIRFLGSRANKTLRIPASALLFDSRGTRVAVVRHDGTIHFATVQVGKDYGDAIEILGGLRGDETIVSTLDETLTEGGHVQIAEAAH
jgi:multidrug efflux pump subunit AcrA (membrane-fusion protein)